ncbi:polyprenyl synthetase family protein [Ligilactobacillus ceti]|uniref:Farnesyl diphosphate synthase n=1 Tax=Ligilactobacillus ceti DSM 22408 TaxID=1122146 RepID=A0A0R2KGZ8_9LACO|nr:farnesyl diphosphate synthase [Ligilactobacillus ceti]KRN88672.1 geranyltranstransferase [Ligilactobacillus ceti DSM 22408]
MNNLSQFMQEYQPLIEKEMVQYLEALDCRPEIKDAMLYSITAGGKRLRPLLTLAVVQSFQGEIQANELKAACALEFIHTYSLIHDDLPEMDNDDLRRGKPTNHKVFGQAMAVLAGDGLLTTAFEWLAQIKLPAEIKLQLIANLAQAAGPAGMINGQVGDILGEQLKLTLTELAAVHHDKTGALLVYACEAGGILSQATAQQNQALRAFGQAFGLAFQIYDDILDVVGTQAELGKAVQKDADHAKNTYPGILGLKGAYQALEETLQAAQQALNQLAQTGLDIQLISEFLKYFKM